jgi:hypothetical protein
MLRAASTAGGGQAEGAAQEEHGGPADVEAIDLAELLGEVEVVEAAA